MDMLGIIFAEMYGEQLDSLTYDRSMAAVPFGGRYRMVDFVLSNLVNSGVTNVGVLAKQHYRSLMDHLSSGQEWDLNRKNGGLHILPPFANESVNTNTAGKLDELRNALDLLEDSPEPYVLLADTGAVYNMDYRAALRSHLDSGCDITAVTVVADGRSMTPSSALLKLESGRVRAFALGLTPAAGDHVAIGIYIISRELLIRTVREYTAFGAYHFERDYIQNQFNQGSLRINAYPIQGQVLFVRSAAEYFSANLALTDPAVACELFRPDAPIYTRVHDEVPAYYGPDSAVSGCIVADGCMIQGRVEHCVLSRGIPIGKGARLKNCIVLQGGVIEADTELENVIIDKRARISAGTRLLGLPASPIIIRKGALV